MQHRNMLPLALGIAVLAACTSERTTAPDDHAPRFTRPRLALSDWSLGGGEYVITAERNPDDGSWIRTYARDGGPAGLPAVILMTHWTVLRSARWRRRPPQGRPRRSRMVRRSRGGPTAVAEDRS